MQKAQHNNTTLRLAYCRAAAEGHEGSAWYRTPGCRAAAGKIWPSRRPSETPFLQKADSQQAVSECHDTSASTERIFSILFELHGSSFSWKEGC